MWEHSCCFVHIGMKRLFRSLMRKQEAALISIPGASDMQQTLLSEHVVDQMRRKTLQYRDSLIVTGISSLSVQNVRAAAFQLHH